MNNDKRLVLVFDVGTQSTRALAFDCRGELVDKVRREEPPYISKNDNRAEKDINELWTGICAVSKQLKERLGNRWGDIAAVTVTSIRNTLFFIDRDGAPTRDAILYVHGYNDYFFQRELGDSVNARGYNFYALDLRKYGRSLRPHQDAFFCKDLGEYFADIDTALATIRSEGNERIWLMGHSTGGLITS